MNKSLPRIITLLCTPEPAFLLPGIPAILVGTAMASQVVDRIDYSLALLAFMAVIAINAGSNMLNDYFDHLSGNDWHTEKVNTFSGGSRYIQRGIITPNSMLTAGIIMLVISMIIGLAILFLTKSLIVLLLGVIGILGGVFWTAPPVKFCYRLPGEIYIGLFVGFLPTYGAYFIQTQSLDLAPLIPALVISITVAMVALINAVPDIEPDTISSKRTFPVRFGIKASVVFYKSLFTLLLILTLTSLFLPGNLVAVGIGMLIVSPLVILAMVIVRTKRVTDPSNEIANKLTLLIHLAYGVAIAVSVVLVG